MNKQFAGLPWGQGWGWEWSGVKWMEGGEGGRNRGGQMSAGVERWQDGIGGQMGRGARRNERMSGGMAE